MRENAYCWLDCNGKVREMWNIDIGRMWMPQDAGWLGADVRRQWTNLGVGTQSPWTAWRSRWCQGQVTIELWSSRRSEASTGRWRRTDSVCCYRRWKGTLSTSSTRLFLFSAQLADLV